MERILYQERYWKELYQLKVHQNYLELYWESSDNRNKAINIFLAIISSTSIAGWAVWQEFVIIWTLIIASSQVTTAIKPFLPYSSRLKFIGNLLHEIDDLLLYAEEKWFYVSEGELTENEIHRLQFDIRTRKTKVLKKYLGNNTLPQKSNLLEKAQSITDIYFDHFYPPEEKTNE